MITAHQIKILHSLDQKKFREKHNLFLVEGHKNIAEIKNSGYKIKDLFCINPLEFEFLNFPAKEISERKLKLISFLKNPKDAVAVCELLVHEKKEHAGIQILLDGIQDPGNLGTIIRLADWFGIVQIICSEDTVDVYNPKVIQASMGSFCRVNIIYQDLKEEILNSKFPVYGTAMNGDNLYKKKFPDHCSIVLGNEGNGIRPEIARIINENITVPRFGENKSTESLNVSIAAAVIIGQIFSFK